MRTGGGAYRPRRAGGGETADKLAVIEKMNALTLSFFDAYLKGEGRFSGA